MYLYTYIHVLVYIWVYTYRYIEISGNPSFGDALSTPSLHRTLTPLPATTLAGKGNHGKAFLSLSLPLCLCIFVLCG